MVLDTGFAILSVAIRISSSLVAFILLARMWGADVYGAFMYAFIVATLVTIVSDYGFNLQVTKAVGAELQSSENDFARFLIAKIVLTLTTIPLALLLAYAMPSLRHNAPIFILHYLGALSLSFSMFFLSFLRAKGRHREEAFISLTGSTMFLALVGLASFLSATPLVVGLCFLLARVLFLAQSWQCLSRNIVGELKPILSLNDFLSTLRSGFPYAIHLITGTFYFYFDTIILEWYLDLTQVGIYQAGLRLVLAAMFLTEAFTNVYLPRLAATHHDQQTFNVYAHRLVSQLTLCGFIAALTLVSFHEAVITGLLGAQYSKLSDLALGLSLFILLRYGATAWGIIITAMDSQSVRAFATMVALALKISLNFALIPIWGISGCIISSLTTDAILIIFYSTLKLRRSSSLHLHLLFLLCIAAISATWFLKQEFKSHLMFETLAYLCTLAAFSYIYLSRSDMSDLRALITRRIPSKSQTHHSNN